MIKININILLYIVLLINNKNNFCIVHANKLNLMQIISGRASKTGPITKPCWQHAATSQQR